MPEFPASHKNPKLPTGTTDAKGTGPDPGEGKKSQSDVDNRTKFAELMNQDSDGRWSYRRIGPAALDWNHAKEDRWNPYLATTKKPNFPPSAPGTTSKADEDATRVYLTHRERDTDPWPFGSLNDVFLVPCHVHDGGVDKDKNPIRRLMLGIDKAEFYADDTHHGALHHEFSQEIPDRFGIESEVWMYYHAPTHTWRWKTTISGGGRKPTTPGAPSTPTPPTTPPTRNPGTVPTGGGAGPQPPAGGGTTAPSGGRHGGPTGGDPSSGAPWNDPMGRGGGAGFDPSNPWGLPGGGLGGGAGESRGSGSGVTHSGGTVAPRGAKPAEAPINPGGATEPGSSPSSPGYGPFAPGGSGRDPYGWRSSPYSRNRGHYVPSRTDGASFNTYQHMGVSPTTTPNAFTAHYSNRPTRAARGWFGTPLYDAGAEYLPNRPSRKWIGTPTVDDPGEVNVSPTVDWTDNSNTTVTQNDYDNWTDPTTRTELFDRINALDAKTTDLDTRARSSIMDCTTVTVLAGNTTVSTATTYAVSGDAPKVVATSAAAGFNVNVESISGSDGTTYTGDVRISDAAPAGGVECSIIWQYAVAAATDVSA